MTFLLVISCISMRHFVKMVVFNNMYRVPKLKSEKRFSVSLCKDWTVHPLTVPKVFKESPKLLNNLRKSRKSRNRLRKAFIVTTKTAVAQITAGSSLLVIPLIKTSNTRAYTTIYQSVTVARN